MSLDEKILQYTKSLCPLCFKSLESQIIERNKEVFLERQCSEHGFFSELIWRGEPSFSSWQRNGKNAGQTENKYIPNFLRQSNSNVDCPKACGLCAEHKQKSCTVLLEITDQCNLNCPVCFANSGQKSTIFKPLALLEKYLNFIAEQAGQVVLQLSGGEPTLYPELIELVKSALKLFPAVQLNTNGLALADDLKLAQDLAKAGLSWVFLQFDGTNDDIYLALRGRKLFEQKIRAIKNCQAAGLSIVLVPTLVNGINELDLGNLLQFALDYAPCVRGLHFQVMTRSGRNSFMNQVNLTLPEVLTKLCEQSDSLIQMKDASAPSCEHERCSFHLRYRLDTIKKLVPLKGEVLCCSGGDCFESVNRSIETVVRSWQAPVLDTKIVDAFDAFIAQAKAKTFSITCMDFQDIRSLDLERLQTCCVHIFDPSYKLIPFCAYNLTNLKSEPLYRK